MLYDDENIPFDVAVTIPLTGQQFSLLVNIIEVYIHQYNEYNVNNFNCTDWVISVINFLGIIELPDAYGSWPLGGGSNCGAMGEYLRTMTLQTGMTRNLNGGDAPDKICNH